MRSRRTPLRSNLGEGRLDIWKTSSNAISFGANHRERRVPSAYFYDGGLNLVDEGELNANGKKWQISTSTVKFWLKYLCTIRFLWLDYRKVFNTWIPHVIPSDLPQFRTEFHNLWIPKLNLNIDLPRYVSIYL